MLARTGRRKAKQSNLYIDANDGSTSLQGTEVLTSDLKPSAGGAAEVKDGGGRGDGIELLLNLNELNCKKQTKKEKML